uniref:Reverse transcriptase domain-containing protein n=1 Tax=Tanacetum cinerariifolium TaxID=118510 RepID=A0A6L2MNA1_TANCI|nr:reverse transcriptase domain-containing protein [Tanacetum cinerariifolium]
MYANPTSGNPTFSLHKEITSPEVTHEIHDLEGCTFLSEELPDIDSFNDIHPHFDDDPLSGSTTYSSNSLLEEFTDELALITYPPDYDDKLTCDIKSDLREIEFLLYQGEDSDLTDSIDQTDLANRDDLFVDPTPEMFTDEHAPDYSFPPRFDVYPDDFLEIESDADNFYDDPFDSKGKKIKEAELLIDELDLHCDFLPYSEYDSFASQDFSRDDDLPSPETRTRYIQVKRPTLPDPWTLFTDKSSCIDGSRAGLILTNPEGTEFTYAVRFRFDATNNEPECEALIAGLRIVKQMGITNLQANVDLRLVANQANGSYIAKDPGMLHCLKKVKILASSFKKFSIKQGLTNSTINEVEVLAVAEEEGDTWMTPIYEYLTKETLLVEKEKARVIQRKSRRYVVINGALYKKSYLGPWLRCVGPLQANYVLREIYEGSCSMHAGTRSVVAKAIRTGYYWPTLHADARKMIQECQDFHVHRPVPRNPQQKLAPIMSPWPFYKWGIDIAGPFPEGPGKRFSSVKHSQANGLVERANKILGEGIKAWLDKRSKDWIEEVPHVLWVHRTMIKSSNKDTPFSLTYRMEAVILAKIGMPTLRTTKIDMVQNDEAFEINLDLLEERRELAAIHEAKIRQR